MNTAEQIKLALQAFINNEDIDEGERNLRNEITTLKELRYALAVASQQFSDDYDEILETLISLD